MIGGEVRFLARQELKMRPEKLRAGNPLGYDKGKLSKGGNH